MTRRYMAPVVLVMVILLSAVLVSAQTKEGVIALAVAYLSTMGLQGNECLSPDRK